MSVKKRLEEKSGDLEPAGRVPSDAAKGGPRTGPGQMLAFRGQMIESSKQVAALQDQLKEFEGGMPTRLLDPAKVFPARWANRSEWSFHDREFEELKDAIRVAGGNVQPIKVRSRANSSGEYEIVFGRRRHRACKDLGLPVLALIDSAMTDLDLFAQMDQENRQRKDLSPWEQGVMYQMALSEGLWQSQRQMSDALGVTQALISAAIIVASLPKQVIDAFPSPNDIQYRWAKDLQKVAKSDMTGLLARAKRATALPKRSSRQVLTMLLDVAAKAGPSIGSVSVVQKRSGIVVECAGAVLSAEQQGALEELVRNFVSTTR